ncbi:LysR family transcriptional regulator [Consotaella salsifontis]|uniref:DNA-binding transcriptional regulator, LysR family n=1 Tax=Consotaella salsifontis TaxID=1365950 RepID=A0A1T4SC24_9HYPH|nr:LysR family transcriptional regulator [Consotaella salsifontis]SKA25745.1 DNA-binding transcriptional regulator, LysR family [Consotaella salsifontis]
MNQLDPLTAVAAPSRLDFDLLQTFVAICESGNFSKAAERVHRTPSAVSLQVKKLEEMLGRELFRREARSVTLTGDGEVLLGYARRMQKLCDETMHHFKLPPMEGRVRFGAPFDSGVVAIPELLSRFARTHPHVEVDVRLDSSTALRRRCLAGEIDLVLVSCDDGHTERMEIVHTEPLVWVGLRHGRAQGHSPLPLALADHGCSWRGRALAALDAAGVSYRISYSSEFCQGQIAAVRADLAIAPLPLSVVEPPLVCLDESTGLPPLGSYDVQLMRRVGAGPMADALALHITDCFRALRGRGARLFA